MQKTMSLGRESLLQENHRFLVLDSWRGICACLVALFHFGSTGYIAKLPFLQGAYLFVDFFFVLSGFVIFASYRTKLENGFGIGRFLLLRFGRLYPLHFALLVAFISADLLKLIPSLADYSAYKPFTAPGETPPYIISNLLLIQSLGIHDRLSWNDPSWSISVEFYVYVFFAFALVALKDKIKWLIFALLIVPPVFLAVFSHEYMDTTYRYGYIRCLFGFSAGALCWLVFERYNLLVSSKLRSSKIWDGMEIVLVALVIVFVTIAGSSALTLAAPFLFSLTILVFAMERGIISRFMKMPLFLFLGLWSYSIYMNHMFIKRKLFVSGTLILERVFHTSLISRVNGGEWMGISPWQGDLFTIVYLLVVVGASWLTFNVIEVPCRNWVKSLVRQVRRSKDSRSAGSQEYGRDIVGSAARSGT